MVSVRSVDNGSRSCSPEAWGTGTSGVWNNWWWVNFNITNFAANLLVLNQFSLGACFVRNAVGPQTSEEQKTHICKRKVCGMVWVFISKINIYNALTKMQKQNCKANRWKYYCHLSILIRKLRKWYFVETYVIWYWQIHIQYTYFAMHLLWSVN